MQAGRSQIFIPERHHKVRDLMENTDINTQLEEKVDELSEKRSSTREAALEFIVKQLRFNFLTEFVEKRKMTLVEAIKRGIRKGSENERELSGSLFSVLCATLGTDAEPLFLELYPILEELISKASEITNKSSLINALSYSCFLSNTDELTTIKVVELLQTIFSTEASPETLAAALNGWALLVTTVNTNQAYDTFTTIVPSIADLLMNEDVDVRLAAGICIALCVQIAREADEEFDFQSFSRDFCQIAPDQLLDSLRDVTSDKSKIRAKKDKAKQRIPFKEIRDYVELGVEPKESLSFKHQKFEFSGWNELIQLDAMRDVLGEGLQEHFEMNDLMQQIFAYDLNRDLNRVQLTQLQKRFLLSPSAEHKKNRTQVMSKKRGEKSISLHSFEDE